MKIPILNIYYLLCYAWNQLEESEIVNVNTEDSTTLLDLFARVLVSGTNHILKRGPRFFISSSITLFIAERFLLILFIKPSLIFAFFKKALNAFVS